MTRARLHFRNPVLVGAAAAAAMAMLGATWAGGGLRRFFAPSPGCEYVDPPAAVKPATPLTDKVMGKMSRFTQYNNYGH